MDIRVVPTHYLNIFDNVQYFIKHYNLYIRRDKIIILILLTPQYVHI